MADLINTVFIYSIMRPAGQIKQLLTGNHKPIEGIRDFISGAGTLPGKPLPMAWDQGGDLRGNDAGKTPFWDGADGDANRACDHFFPQ